MTGGKVAFVTGGSRGIGQAIARALMRAGARVAITATSDDALQRAVRELASEPNSAEVLPIRADEIPHPGGAGSRRRRAAFRGIDVLVNNAGIGVFRAVGDMAVDDWQKILDTNLTGVFYCYVRRCPISCARRRVDYQYQQPVGKTPVCGWGWRLCLESGTQRIQRSPDGEAYGTTASAWLVECLVRFAPNSQAGSAGGDDWKLSPDDVAKVVVDLLSYPSRSLPSAVEIRPARPLRKS